jgi:hypothetical protein
VKFRKKPVVIEAVQYNPEDSGDAMLRHLEGCTGWHMGDGGILIPTLEGLMTAAPGDWIIKGVKGEFYPCKPDIFDATYEPA